MRLESKGRNRSASCSRVSGAPYAESDTDATVSLVVSMTASLKAFIFQPRFQISSEAYIVNSYNGSASIPFPSHSQALKCDSPAVESTGFNRSLHRHFPRCVSFTLTR